MLTLTPGLTQADDVRLAIGGSINGTVTTPSGAPAAGVCVGIDWAHDDDDTCAAVTDGAGTYRITALPAGDYRLCFDTGWDFLAIATECNGDALSATQSTPVHVTLGAATTVDARLDTPGKLVGRLFSFGRPMTVTDVVVTPVGATAPRIETTTDARGYFRVEGLHPGTYQVLGNPWWGSIAPRTTVTISAGTVTNITLSAQPQPPTGLVAYPSNGQAMLTWTPPTQVGNGPVTSYDVQYRQAGTTYWRYYTIYVTGGPWIVTGLKNGVSYSFRIAARNDYGFSTFSNVASTVPAPKALPPVGLAATPGDRSVRLTWEAPDAGTLSRWFDAASPFLRIVTRSSAHTSACSDRIWRS